MQQEPSSLGEPPGLTPRSRVRLLSFTWVCWVMLLGMVMGVSGSVGTLPLTGIYHEGNETSAPTTTPQREAGKGPVMDRKQNKKCMFPFLSNLKGNRKFKEVHLGAYPRFNLKRHFPFYLIKPHFKPLRGQCEPAEVRYKSPFF